MHTHIRSVQLLITLQSKLDFNFFLLPFKSNCLPRCHDAGQLVSKYCANAHSYACRLSCISGYVKVFDMEAMHICGKTLEK